MPRVSICCASLSKGVFFIAGATAPTLVGREGVATVLGAINTTHGEGFMRKDPAIFCPIDFSDPSARALCWASVLARHFGNRLTVAHVDNPLLISAALAAYDTPLLGEVTRAEIEEFAASVLPAIGREASAYGMVTTCGDPTREILSIARQQRATLIVMGSRTLTGWQKCFFGSTTARVLRHTEVPVLAIPPLSHGPLWPDRDGPVLDLGPVLTVVGFGRTSTDHAGAAAELARALHVPHLVTYVGPTFLSGAHGRRAEEITAIVAERHVGLIVVGLGQSRGPWKTCGGRAAYRLLCLARTPVLALPTAMFRRFWVKDQPGDGGRRLDAGVAA